MGKEKSASRERTRQRRKTRQSPEVDTQHSEHEDHTRGKNDAGGHDAMMPTLMEDTTN
jgi:hypothetical protein